MPIPNFSVLLKNALNGDESATFKFYLFPVKAFSQEEIRFVLDKIAKIGPEKSNYAHALTLKGIFLNKGLGEKTNYKAAIKAYEEAIERGSANAMYCRAYMHEEGQGDEADPHAARELYQKAVDRGNTRAMNNLGVMYRNGDCGETDFAAAIVLFERAMKLGNPYSIYNRAQMYERGQGGKVDNQMAWKLYCTYQLEQRVVLEKTLIRIAKEIDIIDLQKLGLLVHIEVGKLDQAKYIYSHQNTKQLNLILHQLLNGFLKGSRGLVDSEEAAQKILNFLLTYGSTGPLYITLIEGIFAKTSDLSKSVSIGENGSVLDVEPELVLDKLDKKTICNILKKLPENHHTLSLIKQAFDLHEVLGKRLNKQENRWFPEFDLKPLYNYMLWLEAKLSPPFEPPAPVFHFPRGKPVSFFHPAPDSVPYPQFHLPENLPAMEELPSYEELFPGY